MQGGLPRKNNAENGQGDYRNAELNFMAHASAPFVDVRDLYTRTQPWTRTPSPRHSKCLIRHDSGIKYGR